MALFITAAIVVVYAISALRRRWAPQAGQSAGAGWAKSGKRDSCKWSPTGNSKGRFVEYRCASCGFDAMSHTGSAPKDCKSNFEKGL